MCNNIMMEKGNLGQPVTLQINDLVYSISNILDNKIRAGSMWSISVRHKTIIQSMRQIHSIRYTAKSLAYEMKGHADLHLMRWK